MISRCGNHFSYNAIHSQVRNKLDDHEAREYIYIFDHFDDYHEESAARRASIDRINEMERWLNEELQAAFSSRKGVELLNAHRGSGYRSATEKAKRKAFRTPACGKKIRGIVAAVLAKCA